jgi:hypothetical protein
MSTTAEQRIKAVIREENAKTRDFIEELITNVVISLEGHPADAALEILTESEQ